MHTNIFHVEISEKTSASNINANLETQTISRKEVNSPNNQTAFDEHLYCENKS